MNIFKIPVHPAADVFPILDESDLAELSEDIKENGLRSPLVVSGLDGDMVLIDGRNRRAACKIAGVEPTTIQVEGDPVAYIISTNINRRHLTAGQRTMIVAKIYPEPGSVGRGKKGLLSKQFNKGSLSQARLVLKVLPELADQVIKGDATLGEAYARAQAEQAEYGSVTKQMERLKAAASDLFELVQAGKMQINEAMAAHRERERRIYEEEANRVNGINSGLLVCIVRAKELIPDLNQARRYRAFLMDEPEKVTAGGDAKTLKKIARELIKLLSEVVE